MWLLGTATVEVMMWDGNVIDCEYVGDLNPDGEAHGIGKATCEENDSSFDGQFMFDVAHGKRKQRTPDLNLITIELFTWPDFGIAIYEYRQGELHGKECLFVEG